MTTHTEKIFQLSSPYNNPYQGVAPRVLFVCSAGLLRSPTGATIGARDYGWNTRAAGSHKEYALVELSANLIMWAKVIVFVNAENYQRALNTFKGTNLEAWLKDKALVLNIPDSYEYMDPQLVHIMKQQLDPLQEALQAERKEQEEAAAWDMLRIDDEIRAG